MATRPRYRELLRDWQKVPHRVNVFLSTFVGHWPGGGPQARRAIPHTGSRGLVSAECFLPVLKP